jgi:hypothetical protein
MWPNSQSEPSPRDQSSQSRPDCGEKRRQRKVIGNSVNLWQARRATCRLSYFPARPVASVTGSDNWFDSNFANSGMSSPTAHVRACPAPGTYGFRCLPLSDERESRPCRGQSDPERVKPADLLSLERWQPPRGLSFLGHSFPRRDHRPAVASDYGPLGLPPGSVRLQPSDLIPTVLVRPDCRVGSLLFRDALSQRATACDPGEVQHTIRFFRMLSVAFAVI